MEYCYICDPTYILNYEGTCIADVVCDTAAHYYNPEIGECFPCTANCDECHLFNWMEECIVCADGFGLSPWGTCEEGQSNCYPGTYEKKLKDGTFNC